ncbi:Glycerate 2-kinase [subsurface metagenome]
MKILIAPDSFKDCLPANEVALSIELGILKVFPDAEIIKIPLADGGEGTVEALVNATGGKIINIQVHDPLMRKIDSFFGILGNRKTAVIEMAAASGIELLTEKERNPWLTTTFGTGELIKAALDFGCQTILIGIGGSATVDGGAGMVQALGVELLDKKHKSIAKGGKGLAQLNTINTDTLDVRLKGKKIWVACDVKNPLLGENGAAKVYGPQKGANPEMINKLEQNLAHYSEVIETQLGITIANIPGTGAAGGLGAGFMAFLNAEIKPGFELISEIVHLEEHIANTDLVITAEGKIDYQTRFGKTPAGVAGLALKYKKPLLAFAGSIGPRVESLNELGFTSIIPITDKPMSLQESITNAGELLMNAAERTMRILKLDYWGFSEK